MTYPAASRPAARPIIVQRAWRGLAALRRSKVASLGVVIILFWVLVALFAPLIAPLPPNATMVPMLAPGSARPDGGVFLLGTDHLGRDILSRIIWGARTVLFYAPVATLSAYAVGALAGLVAGYKRGWIDELLSRCGDL